jgi:hypothetical protein
MDLYEDEKTKREKLERFLDNQDKETLQLMIPKGSPTLNQKPSTAVRSQTQQIRSKAKFPRNQARHRNLRH